jgi:hypothetical protein
MSPRNPGSHPDEGLTPQGKTLLAGTVWIIIILALIAVGFFTRNLWWPMLFAKTGQPGTSVTRVVPTVPSNNQSPTTQNGSQPTTVAGSTQPGSTKPNLTICFVTFPSYLPVVLIPAMNDPAYNAVLYPLQFTAPDGTQVTIGSEPEQVQMMQSGQCDVLFTTPDTLAKHPSMGKLIAIVDQSDGADKTVAWSVGRTQACAGKPINIFNDLKGCTIAATGDSVSEFQALSFLKLAGLTHSDVNLDTSYSTAADAVQAFLEGKADAVSGWEPDITSAVRSDTKILVSSKFSHTIYDGIFVSPNAEATKHDLITNFLADWFISLVKLVNDPNGSSEAIAAWAYQGYPTNSWTFVNPGTAKDDMAGGLGTIAQAGFDINMVYLAHPELWTNMLSYERGVWEWSGDQLETPFDTGSLVDSTYLQALANRTDLRPATGSTFVDNTFSPFPPDQPIPTADQLIQLPTVAEFGCPGFAFKPDSVALDPKSADYANFVGCAQSLLEMLKQSDVQILITGSAAQPDPKVFGDQYNLSGTLAVADQRALSVMTALINMGFPSNRIATLAVAGPVRQNLADMPQDRWVKIEIKASSASLH